MSEIISEILAASARMGTPIVLAAYGELLCERSGVLNLGTEGAMIMGSFTSFFIYITTGNLVLAVILAMITGAFMSSIMVITSIRLRADQMVAGIGVWLLGLGLSGFLYKTLVPGQSTIDLLQTIKIPVLVDIPIIGPAFFSQNVLVYLTYIIAPAIWFLFFKTSLGLKIRSIGENPAASNAVGIGVIRLRSSMVIAGGALVGLGGAALIHSSTALFIQNVTAFRGFIAIAVVIFSGWNPFWILGGAFLIGGVEAIQMRVQLLGTLIPYRFLVMLPYIVPIIILALMSRRRGHRAPAALGQPYPSDESRP